MYSNEIVMMQGQMAAREHGIDHSQMAMQAARRMRRSKQKQKTGRVVCHHLRMMLVAEHPVAKPYLPASTPKSGEKQFGLGF
jgi:hypothetical protein